MRECMIDGPKAISQGMQAFFKAREGFIYEQFGRELDYNEYVVSQFNKMRAIPEGSELCFWFEDDLFCQANWWFLLYYLKDVKANKYLVRAGDASPYSFATLSDNQLLKAYDGKEELTENELTSLWQHYESETSKGLEALPETFFKAYPYVKSAFKAHIDRLPSKDALGLPKETLKAIGAKIGFEDFGSVFQEFQKRLPYYGYGDLQVLNMIKELKKEM